MVEYDTGMDEVGHSGDGDQDWGKGGKGHKGGKGKKGKGKGGLRITGQWQERIQIRSRSPRRADDPAAIYEAVTIHHPYKHT